MKKADTGVTATSDSGQEVEVRDVDRQTGEGEKASPGVQATSDSGRAVETRDVDRSADVDPLNPLGEEEIDVRAKVEFHHMGELRKAGDEFPMAVSQARAAYQYVEARNEDGSYGPVPSLNQRTQANAAVPRAQVAGKMRHERIEALQQELDALKERAESVQRQIDREIAAVRAAQGPATEPAQDAREVEGSRH